MVGQRTALILNGILITAYIVIYVYAAGVRDWFIGVLILASLNRSLGLYWLSRRLSTFLWSLVWQMFCAGVLTGFLWYVAPYWPDGVLFVVCFLAVLVVWMSLYPVRRRRVSEE